MVSGQEPDRLAGFWHTHIGSAWPSLTDLVLEGNLETTTDFRHVYATLIDWMGADPAKVLEQKFDRVGMFRT